MIGQNVGFETLVPESIPVGESAVNAAVIIEPMSAVDLDHAVRAACARVAPVWPLERFVAVNPYLGLTDHSFAAAAQRLHHIAGVRTTMDAAAYLDLLDAGRISAHDLGAELITRLHRAAVDDVDARSRIPTVARVASDLSGADWHHLAVDRISAWAAAYFDDGQASWRSTDRHQGVFASWKDEASIDRTPEVMGLRGFRSFVRSLPDDPITVIDTAVAELGVDAEDIELYLHATLLQVGGWSAHAARIVWDHQLVEADDDTLVQFLAVLVAWELGLFRCVRDAELHPAWVTTLAELHAPADSAPLTDLIAAQDAYDAAERRRLAAQFASAPTTGINAGPAGGSRPSAQAVFCIDVRSEVFRRHLEAAAPGIDTIGFAGFFGFPIEYLPLAHDAGEAQCPVLLTPAFAVSETVDDPDRQTEAVEARRLAHHVRKSWKSFKMGAISCFSFVGPVGLAYLPKMFTDSYGRTRPVARAEDEALPGWTVGHRGPAVDLPLDQRVALATGALRGMSLTEGFAPIVLIAGHGASTVNNPYDTGLACGACGGHTGEANARVAATVLNDPDVRAALVEIGITIPADTWFVAAQHNTTTDEVTLFDRTHIPEVFHGALAELADALATAGQATRAERARRMNIDVDGMDTAAIDAAVLARSTDWAQVRPEWGLAGCRTFVAAPRSRTAPLDLGGRSFLHSYDWQADDGFGVLELIMTAPMVVASWISLQYYASTVDNDAFGSGNKTLHNVVGRIGVLEGNGGDLRVGLPWQSVHDGEKLAHEPLRLTVVIEAPIDAMNDVLARHADVAALVDNGWLSLLAMDADGHISHHYTGGGRWDPITA